jgi:hypothetical protein
MGRTDTIRLWTVQPQAVWDRLLADGVLKMEPSLALTGAVPDAYQLLAKRLGGMPWFAHTRRRSVRWLSRTCWAGEKAVRLSLRVPRDRVLVLRTWAWTVVLGECFLPLSGAEHRAWEAGVEAAVEAAGGDWDDADPPFPEPWQSRLEASHHRLFDDALPARDPRRDSLFRFGRTREAAFAPLRIGWVRRVDAVRGTLTIPGGRPPAAGR